MRTDAIELFVSPAGAAYADGSAGYPVPDLVTARDVLRRRRDPGEPAVVWVAPGHYPMTRPLELGPEDSFTSFVALDPDRPPVFEGAATLTGWAETEVNGVSAWWTTAPKRCGRSFFVGGERRPRPRLPRDGFLRVADQPDLDLDADMVSTLFDGTDAFQYAEGDLPELADPSAVEVVVPHYWVQERMPVRRADRATRTVHTRVRSIFSLRDDAARRFARYYLDNVLEAFGEMPGEWYHDLAGRRLLYVPRPEDRLDSFGAKVPVLEQFVVVRGRLDRREFVRSVRFERLRFSYADWAELPPARPPFDHREDPALPRDVAYAAAPQAAADVGAALVFTGARGCSIVACTVDHVGGYAVELGYGCQGNLLSGNTLTDLGAGAVKMSGSTYRDDPAFTAGNEISDNEISAGGRVYPQAVGVLARHTASNLIAHNHIHDLCYSGISCGWVWDYDTSPSTDNVIEGNHIHHLGTARLLGDLGGIYLLGVAPGTVVRNNHIHDIACANYGGWGIYLDAGSSYVVVEDNVCHDVDSQCLHIHYGRENIVRHNVLAFGRLGAVALTRPEDHVTFTFERNIVLTAGVPAFVGAPGDRGVLAYGVVSDLNLVWDTAGPVCLAGNGRHDPSQGWSVVERLDKEWRALGHDAHTVVADPGFADPDARDLTLLASAPASEVGIRVPDVSRVGPRPGEDRPNPLARRTASPDRRSSGQNPSAGPREESR
ncbi:right-handed parallel beta-helix repeat-containing protein [Actinopolymorpha sp. B11F2]|uniref:right-handed parallel beta-helix repeat-containing protein n=1 Tax=Actinopolymorpha sp. B11F2 TaxID=3160862 RepID=UPI0032E3FBAA